MGLEREGKLWEIPPMTAVADNRKRVTIKSAKPGDRFDVQVTPDGKVTLTPLVPIASLATWSIMISFRAIIFSICDEGCRFPVGITSLTYR